MSIQCTECKKEMDESFKFCPSCGKVVEVQSDDLSTGKKVRIYFLSVILAPLGLYWVAKYFRDPRPKVRRVAYFAMGITIVTLALITVVTSNYIKVMNSYIEGYNQGLEYYAN